MTIIDSGMSSLNSTFATSHGQLTELAGLPGLGKTQLCIQLAASVLKSKEQVIYIDTEGSFSIARLFQMTNTLVNTKDLVVYRATSIPELLSVVMELNNILKTYDRTRLIILDSIAFLFKGVVDYNQRSLWLNQIGQELKKISWQKQILVVLTNQMTTKLHNTTGILVPALGESWGHVCNNRIFLFWKDGKRKMYLAKSAMAGEKIWEFSIEMNGLFEHAL